MNDSIQVTVISTGFNTVAINKEEQFHNHQKPVPTRTLQDLENKPLHAQKNESFEEQENTEKRKLIFDDTQETPTIYEKRIDVPAFLRKQQD